MWRDLHGDTVFELPQVRLLPHIPNCLRPGEAQFGQGSFDANCCHTCVENGKILAAIFILSRPGDMRPEPIQLPARMRMIQETQYFRVR